MTTPLEEFEAALQLDQSHAGLLASQLGDEALSVLRAHVGHPDVNVRVRTMHTAQRFPKALDLLILGLRDPERVVRMHALDGVRMHATSQQAEALEAAYSFQTELIDALELVHLFARVGTAERIPHYKAARSVCGDWQLAAAWTTTLARLGDREAQRDWLLAIFSAPEAFREMCFKLSLRVCAPWAHPVHRLFLDDTETAFDYPDRYADGTPCYVRRCDVVVNILATAFGWSLPFETRQLRHFSASERKQIESLLPQSSVLDETDG